jgi:hypothetical protein
MTERHPEELLAPFVDGELTGDEHRAVEAHVASCPVCAREVGLARRAALALGGLDQVPSPAGLSTPAIQHARPGSRLVRRLGWAATGAAAAALVTIFAVSQLTSSKGAADSALPGRVATNAGPGDVAPEALSSMPLYTESDRDYSQDALRERLRADRRASATAAYDQAKASDETLQSPEGQAALLCVNSAGLRADEGAKLIQIELARYEGAPAYVVLFWRSADSLELWVVDQETCQIRFLANA